MDIAGFIYGSDTHYIDHLAPLCDLFNIPLFITEESLERQIQKFYPTVITYLESKETICKKILKNYRAIFSCLPSPMIRKIFFFEEHVMRKKILPIWAAHGNSDKGRNTLFMEALFEEKIALVYGQNMIDFLDQKNVLKKLYAHIQVGNYRHHYYLQRKLFYDRLVINEVTSKFREKKPILLYAPTWGRDEKTSPVTLDLPKIVSDLPDHYNLIVKMHPNTLTLHPHLENKMENRPNLLFLYDFAPIYPLLNVIDGLIGDFSSINYDFLTFEKPLFFLGEKEKTAIRECGITIENRAEIFQTIDKHLFDESKMFKEKKQTLYAYTFSLVKSYEMVQKQIEQTVEKYLEEELDFL
ncbi:MAG: hypothetical protein FJZ56_00675 [Chlamydiae bacterium]|nr:hypothetical protein [Chlamydiota bacterium]